MHDVVITGMGVVSPLGATVDEFERNLFQGRHGIVPLPEERKEGLTVQVYAPVAGFEPESHFSALELRRQDPYTTFGLAAVREAVSASISPRAWEVPAPSWASTTPCNEQDRAGSPPC